MEEAYGVGRSIEIVGWTELSPCMDPVDCRERAFGLLWA
jgi:hypothetical protein